ncbi:MAG TPA: GNAT family N-acetyltransferase [Kofleriaceae bacterium]|jgi:RimJ/RimL family protein N-acetyltransferase|nr:GNAT family N-acetyltransferase [Kofleriaceae bacterium]
MTAQAELDRFVHPDRVVIRPLTAADGEAYRRLRQHILDSGEGKFFSSSYIMEQHLTSEDQWREQCAETPMRCTIGVFVEAELAGIMGILPHGDPSNLTAEWIATWIAPKYRGSGITGQAYKKVREWSRNHGYRYAVGDIRADNTRSREIREKQGAMYLFTRRNVTWADGSTADAHFFILNLLPGEETSRSVGQAVAFLEAALAFVKHEQRADATAGVEA